MRVVDLIETKRDGGALSKDEIDFAIDGFTSGTIPDYQVSALLMTIVLRGMTQNETHWLTDAMVRSGERVDLSDIPGTKVGKHSTGGVGDKVSIVLAPVVASCGVVVPKMSGRGLGHTGGTLDKLESIPGFRTNLSIDDFKRGLRTVGTCIVGQTDQLAPADRKLYALRDVTGTVPSAPLIAASIMSKKIAEGCDALVLDVTCGGGAFMKDVEAARALAELMVDIGRGAGLRTEAVLTDMEAPLGSAVGNALEVIECLDVLRGTGPDDVRSVVVQLAARMLVLGGSASDIEAGVSAAARALESGRALETFARMVEYQGGDPAIVSNASTLPRAPGRAFVTAPRAGFVAAVSADAVGRASHALGAGRTRVGEPIDHAVGVVVRVHAGVRVEAGACLVELHHRDGRGLDEATALCAGAVSIADEPVGVREPVLGEVA